MDASNRTQLHSIQSEVDYVAGASVTATQLAELFRSSGIRRPVDDLPRLQRMLQNANLIVGAYIGSELVGVARALTDFSYCCYLSDLAVSRNHQHLGIGRELVARVKHTVGDQSMLLLLSSPEAMAYYPKIGMAVADNAWIIKRVG